MKKCIAGILFFFLTFCFAQENSEAEPPYKTGASEKPGEAVFSELPQGYRDITLGMDIESVKTALKADSIFGYRGERDISLLAGKSRSLIETAGSSNIKRAWFQFYDEKLYIITIQMNTDKIDYYSIYSALCKKYGDPNTLDPKRSIWKNENIALILERPLALKYIDLTVFNDLIEKNKTDKAYTDILREEFINDL